MALLYYTGHGLVSSDRASLFLAASDTREDQLHGTALDTLGLIGHLLSLTRASQKVVLLDCCASGLFQPASSHRSSVSRSQVLLR